MHKIKWFSHYYMLQLCWNKEKQRAEFMNANNYPCPISLSELKRLQIFLNKLIDNVEEAKRNKQIIKEQKLTESIPY